MLGVNPSNNFRARLFGVDHRTNDPMPGLDEGKSIPLETPYQARWGNKITNTGKRMFNVDSLLKERMPNDFPNHYHQTGAPDQMEGIVQSAFFAEPPLINGDQLDVINQINAMNAVEEKAYRDNLGKDHLFETMSETKMRMSMESYEAKHAHLIRQGFTNQEAEIAIGHLRQEHAKKIAQEHRPPVGTGLEEAVQSAFAGRVRA